MVLSLGKPALSFSRRECIFSARVGFGLGVGLGLGERIVETRRGGVVNPSVDSNNGVGVMFLARSTVMDLRRIMTDCSIEPRKG